MVYIYMHLCWIIFLIGEDEQSFARHNRALQAEFKKSRPNYQVVEELMDLSFQMRHDDINNPCNLTTLLQKYPFLKIEDEVSIIIL